MSDETAPIPSDPERDDSLAQDGSTAAADSTPDGSAGPAPSDAAGDPARAGAWTPPPGGWTAPTGGGPATTGGGPAPAGGWAGSYPSPSFAPPSAPPPGSVRQLRRSSTDRVAAGVSGGLGEYFGIDPVIFRVLFAITAFFGIGVVAYLIAWAIIPDVGSTNPPLDRMVAELRRRHVPLWLVAVVGVVLAWAVVASWWAPWPMVPIALAAVVLVAAFNRQGRSFAGPPATPAGFPSDPVQTVSMHKTAPNPSPYGWDSGTTTPLDESAFPPPVPAPAPSAFANWVSEARAARKARRHRNLPMRIATWGIWILAVAVLAIIDAIHRIPMPTYLWLSVGIVVAALAVGAAVRRPVFGFAVALLPLAILLFALGPTRASLHDGSGDYTYAPTSASALDSHYRTAFGRTTLDLSDLPALTSPTTITITQAAGQVRVLVPRSVNVTVISHVHIGTVDLDNSNRRGGVGITEPIRLNAGTGSTLTINVDLADGDVSVQNRS